MRKRHHSQFNLSAPFINLKNDIKSWWKNKDWREKKKINERANIIFFTVVIIGALIYGVSKIIAYEYTEYQFNKLENIRLNREAVEREERAKKIQQQRLLLEQEENEKHQRQVDASLVLNKEIAKQVKKRYPIGTYIKVNNEWVGKVKSINGNRIITTDGWQCYVSEDDIEYSQYKEYAKFIKENSKG